MSIRTFGRCGAVLTLGLLIVGCSATRPEQSAKYEQRADNKCKWNRSSCLYEGSYEPDERLYAEDEAKRLNRAQLARLRRG